MTVASRLLSLEETWHMREHPFDLRVVRVRKLAQETEALEQQAAKKYTEFEAALKAMNEHRGQSNGN